MQGLVNIEFLQQPLNGMSFSYTMIKNGTPFMYDNGDTDVNKRFVNLATASIQKIGKTDSNFLKAATFSNSTYWQASDIVYDILVSTQGEAIYVGGFFQSQGGIDKIHYDGSNDTTFDTHLAFSETTGVRTLAQHGNIASSHVIYMGGDFTGSLNNDTTVRRILKLKTIDDSIDYSFVQGAGFNAPVYKIKVLSSGDILVGGTFLTYNNVYVNRLAKLSATGTLNTTFNSNYSYAVSGNGLNGRVRDIFEDLSGKYLCVGLFQGHQFGVTWRESPCAIRFNSNGTIDNTFVSGFSAGSDVYGIQYDGFLNKYYLIGRFTSYSENPVTNIVRINADGSYDPTFNVSVNGLTIYSILLETDGSLTVGGDFTIVNGQRHNKIAKIASNGEVISNSTNGFTGINGESIYAFTVKLTFTNQPLEGLPLIFNITKTGFSYNFNKNFRYTASTETSVQIGSTLDATLNNVLANLNTYNTNSNIVYTKVGTDIILSFIQQGDYFFNSTTTPTNVYIFTQQTNKYEVQVVKKIGNEYLMGGRMTAHTFVEDEVNDIVIGATIEETQGNTFTNLVNTQAHSSVTYISDENDIKVYFDYEISETLEIENVSDADEHVEIEFTDAVELNVSDFILAGSPYYIKYNAPAASFDYVTVDLYLWVGENLVPTTVSYNLQAYKTKNINDYIWLEISDYVKGQLEPKINLNWFANSSITVDSTEITVDNTEITVDSTFTTELINAGFDEVCWCKWTLKAYKLVDGVGILADTVNSTIKLCSLGYGFHAELNNPVPPSTVLVEAVDKYSTPTTINYLTELNVTATNTNEAIIRTPVTTNKCSVTGGQREFQILYLNKFGVWDVMLFNRASRRSINITSDKYQLYQDRPDTYSKYASTSRVLNRNAVEEWTFNTDLLDESQNKYLEEIVESDRWYLLYKGDFTPMILLDKKLDEKTSWNDKAQIKYPLKFEIANNKINDIR